MELVGQIIKKTRESKKLSLLEVSEELKISVEILDNIENDYFRNDIDIVFILGHLRAYCSFLNLNQNEIIDQFKLKYISNENNKIEIERPIIKNSLLFSNKFFSLSIIIILFTTFYFLFVEVDKSTREYAIIPDLPENYVSLVEGNSIKNISNNNISQMNEEKSFASLENLSSSSAFASLPNNENIKSKIITLKIIDDTWVQIRDGNDEIIFSQLMNKNDEYSYDLDQNYSITSGNAGHILVLIDQKVKGKIGKKGQVVDSLVINKDFYN